jgi:hypothetical protein
LSKNLVILLHALRASPPRTVMVLDVSHRSCTPQALLLPSSKTPLSNLIYNRGVGAGSWPRRVSALSSANHARSVRWNKHIFCRLLEKSTKDNLAEESGKISCSDLP